jgi:hypothetical protein
MINNVQSAYGAAQAALTQSVNTARVETAETKPADERAAAVMVSLSPAAEGAKKLLSDLPPFIVDPAYHMEKAQDRLKELMTKYGIPEGTKLNISSDNAGNFKIEGDHPMISVIEEKVNDGSERDLRNSLVGAHTGMTMVRIGTAVEMAMQGADKTPQLAELYYDWVRNVASSATNSKAEFTFDQGKLHGSLVGSRGALPSDNSDLVLPA